MNTLSKYNPFQTAAWDPVKEIEEMQNRLSSFFRRPIVAPDGKEEAMILAEWAPLIDVSEDDKEYVIKAELPEVKREEVKVNVKDGVLSISGERKFEKEEKGKKYHRIERSYGSFLRSFTVPEGTNPDKVTAEFKDGVLKVHLPKDEKAQPKTVEVKVS